MQDGPQAFFVMRNACHRARDIIYLALSMGLAEVYQMKCSDRLPEEFIHEIQALEPAAASPRATGE